MEKLKKLLNSTNRKTFLDIGTGQGNFIHLVKSIYDNFEEIVGIDVLEKSVEQANGNIEDSRVSFEVMDGFNMSFDDDSFDVVTFSNSLHHVADSIHLLQEMKRVLKPDGFIIINEMLADNLNNMQESHKMLHHLSAKVDRLKGRYHDETFTEEEIKEKLTENDILSIQDSWYLDVERVQENTKEELEYFSKLLKRIASMIPEENKDELQIEIEEIQNHINKYGFDGCTSLITILKK